MHHLTLGRAVAAVAVLALSLVGLTALPAHAVGGTISGHITLDTVATPAGAGQVEIVMENCGYENWGYCGSPQRAALTDASGAFSFPSSNGKIKLTIRLVSGTAYQPIYRVNVTMTEGAALVVDRTMIPTRSLSGQVFLGSTATPAGAGQVEVRYTENDDNGQPHWNYLPKIFTDADGRYTITGLNAGYHRLQFVYSGADRAYSDEYYDDASEEQGSRSVYVSTTDVTGVTATLEAAASISGRVTHPDGSPFAGITVVVRYGISGPLFEDKTDADGLYSIVGLRPNTYYPQFMALEFGMGDIASHYWDDTIDGVADPVELTAGQARTGIDMIMYKSAGVSGNIICGTCAISNAVYLWVTVQRHTAGAWVDYSSDSPYWPSGYFSIQHLVPGEYRVVVRDNGGDGYATYWSDPFTLTDGGQQVLGDLSLTRPGARDLNGDSYTDILTRNTAGKLVLYTGTGGGQIGGSRVIGSGWASFSAVLSVGDMSGDDLPDLIGRDSAGALWLYKSNGTGGFLPGRTKVGSGWKGFSALFSPGDFDGDGTSDLLARDLTGALWLYRGTGSGGFLPGRTKVGSGLTSYTALFSPGDFTSDGRPDLVARDAAGALWLYPGTGTGFGARIKIGSGWKTFTAVFSVGDFDGDGRPDLLARDSLGYLWLYPGNGDHGFLPRYRIATAWKAVKIAS